MIPLLMTSLERGKSKFENLFNLEATTELEVRSIKCLCQCNGLTIKGVCRYPVARLRGNRGRLNLYDDVIYDNPA